MCWKISMPKMPTVNITARDITPYTESKTPEAFIPGGDISFTTSARKRGIASLKIDPTPKVITNLAEQNGYNY